MAFCVNYARFKPTSAPELGREARVDRDRWPSLPADTIDAGGPADQPEEPFATIVERLRREYWFPMREQRRRIAIDYYDWYYMPIYEGEPTIEINRRHARVHNRPFDDLTIWMMPRAASQLEGKFT